MNPFISLFAALLLAVTGFGYGHHVGQVEQKAEDQQQFDKINAALTAQKAAANAAYRKAQDSTVALLAERDQLKTTLEKQHEENRRSTDALRRHFSGVGLRFRASDDSRLGGVWRSAESAGVNPAVTSPAAVEQLPDALAADLRQLAFDADELSDAYRKCYGYANQVK